MSDKDEKFMQMALKLARRGIGSVEPNPAVGSVIVKAGHVIARGCHEKFGGPHAEINALEDCKKQRLNPKGATMYVTLEPCCHHGKTSPCTNAIIESQLAKVVIAMTDPSDHAAGRGTEQLRKAGIEVQTGCCENEAKLLNAPFIKFATTAKCWVILKWAQTIDAKLAYADSAKGRWISGQKSRKDAHKLRRRAQAILVGINTVIADDPLLTPRPSKGKNPARIVLDTHLRIPTDSKLLATAKKTPVIIVTSAEAIQANQMLAEKITKKGAELLTVPTTKGRCALDSLLDHLSKRGVQQLLIEGGPNVIASFLKQNLADEIVVYIAPKILGSGGDADISEAMTELTDSLNLHHVDIKRLGDDIRLTGRT
ncbi:MAG: bifunctional diaminohydroxyphosphoribosylaminopyrimidine deaminase/5-amino-6-(5-phosphoribosylamino)uracil reductase RibD [Planctomycetota bacterium]|jgi:diaminohydroxyphosphoribosylaminopyrimidine deaminase/5-amino-6-(5-phosphoribosylamino)uracil reductase